MLSFGGATIGEEGEPTLDNPQNAEAIEFLKKIYDAQGGFANVKSFVDAFDVFGGNNSYVADQVGAAVFDQWYVNVLTPYAEQVQISATPLVNQEGEPFTVASGSSFVIPTAAKNPSAACAYVLALTSPDAWEAAGAARNETTVADPDRNGINAGLFTGSPENDQSIRDAVRDRVRLPRFRPGHRHLLRGGGQRPVVRFVAGRPADPDRAAERGDVGSAR